MDSNIPIMPLLTACFLFVFMTSAAAQNYQVTFSIKEQAPKDTFVGNVTASFQFLNDIPSAEIGYIKYSFLQQTYIQTLLKLHESSGILSTAIVIDRESKDICQSQTTCSMNFDIAVRSSRPQSSFFEIISVTLVITDINDNRPKFPQTTLHLDVSESTIIGTSFHIESAVDLDSGIFSVQSYEIREQDGNFVLDVVKKLDGGFSVKLVLNATLDRETKRRYTVVIIAMDGGSPKKFGALTVNITVTDVNDNPPVFTETNYNVTVRENATIGTTILQITATDKDTGENGRISYSFSQNQNDARVTDIFTIERNSGDLLLKNRLVYEAGTYYKIIVEASDNGLQPKVTQVIAMIHVLDIGNNPPVLEINLLSAGNSRIVHISEAAIPGTFVAHIKVTDKDTGRNGEVGCQISDRKFELLSMAGNGYKVVVKDELDRETQDLHQILVSCSDRGTPPLSNSSSFMVSLTDVNDQPPVFTRPMYTGIIPENHHDFRTFVQVVAYDEELGRNGEVRYSIDKKSTVYRFHIDEISGNIRADQTFDREMTPVVTLRVIARDLGNPSLSSVAMVKLTISDENDNRPKIIEPTEFVIQENKDANSVVGLLRAKDADEGPNGRLMFVIKEEFEYTMPFVVFPDGKIQTKYQLDREVQNVYNFTVVVVDQGSPRLSSSANITIRVSDTNDNTPMFKFPKGKNNTVVVFSNVKAGNKISAIEVVDLDEGINSISSFEIKSGNEEDIFAIDTKLGGVYLTRKVEIKQNKTSHLKIVVKDGGSPQKTAECDLYIVLTLSNASGIGMGEKDEGNNTIIVIIVVVLTIVLSLTMILVICFLRRFDHRSKARKNLEIVAPDEKYPNCYRDNGSPFLDNSNSSHDQLTLTYDPMSSISTNKKKEVSFDIDESTQVANDREFNNTSMSTFSQPEPEKCPPPPSPEEAEDQVAQGRLNKLQLLQYHQAVLECQTRAWLQSQDTPHEESSSFETTLPDDKFSDTSEEVTASDSGKGGSEDDIPSHHSKDKYKTQGAVVNKFKTHHYVAPEFRRQGSLQRKACDLNFDDLRLHSPHSPTSAIVDEICCRPDSRGSITHSTPRPNSRAALYYTQEFSPNRTLDSTVEQGTDWDSASYV